MKNLHYILIVISLALASAKAETLIPYGSVWKYLDNGSNQGTAWRAPGFDDSSWAAGPSQLGYGDGDEATTVAYVGGSSNRNATTYFRKTFTVTNLSQYAGFTLKLLYDDAGAVYINGTNVARTANLPTNAAYNTYATSTSAENSIQTWNLVSSVLVFGTNTIAVEIHQASGNSTDISFDLELASNQPVVRGPYLQINNESGVTIRWRTTNATDSVVRIGTAQGVLTTAVTDATSATEHEVRVAGLQPDTKYFYAIGTTATNQAGNDADHFFMTAPAPGTDRPMRIWVLGDCGTGDSNERAVRDAYYNSSEYKFNDMVLLLGDNAYDTGTDAEHQAALFDMFPAVLRQSPVWSCLGNHETSQDQDGIYTAPYFDIFSFPTNAQSGGYPSGTERYFSWDFGNIHFISLDTQTTTAMLRTNMLAWLNNDLAANMRRWTIACWHQPPYTKGSHNSDTESQLIWARENLLPPLEAAGVDLVLCGHSHSYERSWLIDGFYATPTLIGSGTVIDGGDGKADGDGAYGKDYGANQGAVYAVAGSSGKISGGTLNHPVMFKSLNHLGSMIVDISGNRLDAKFLNNTGIIEDDFRIEKGPLVTVSATVSSAAEYGPVTGTVSVTRSGSTANPLSVQMTVGGTAPGSRYTPVTVPVTIPAGSATSVVDIVPLPDAIFQGSQTVVLSGVTNIAYRLGTGTTATISISDTPAGAPSVAGWHLAQFGTGANDPAISGNTVDLEGDGLPNLLEYALVLDPAATNIPIDAGMISNRWIVTFQRDATRTDVDLELLWTDDLIHPGWIPVIRTLGGAPVETTNGAVLIRETGESPGTVEVQIPNNLPHAYIRWQATPRQP